MLNKSTIVFWALVGLYAVVRLWRLDDSCLWFDELFSVHAAEHSWDSLFWFIAQDLIHPPLFYVLLKLWIGVGGEGVFWLRLLPVLFSVLALFPFVRLCRELKLEQPVILLSLGLLAVNGALIKYTQTVRMYSMLMCLSLLSMWLFARYFNRGKSFVPLVIANVLLVYTHYFGWLVIGAEIGAILILQPIKWRRAATMFGVVALSFLPWFVAVWQAARQGSDLAQNIAWQVRPGIRQLITFAIDLVEPFYFQASSAEPASIYLVSVPLLIVVGAAMTEYVIKWDRKQETGSGALLALFVVVPLVVAFTASWLMPHSVWGTRHLIIALPPAMILFANAILGFHLRAVRIGSILLVIVLCAVAFLLASRREPPRHVWCAWNDAAVEVGSRSAATAEPTTIYAFENLVAYHLWFALRDDPRFRVVVVKAVDVPTDDESYFLPRGFDEVRKLEMEDVVDERIWLAFRTTKPGQDAALLEKFTRIGYTPCPSTRAKYDSTTVFWLELTRSPGGCQPKTGAGPPQFESGN